MLRTKDSYVQKCGSSLICSDASPETLDSTRSSAYVESIPAGATHADALALFLFKAGERAIEPCELRLGGELRCERREGREVPHPDRERRFPEKAVQAARLVRRASLKGGFSSWRIESTHCMLVGSSASQNSCRTRPERSTKSAVMSTKVKQSG